MAMTRWLPEQLRTVVGPHGWLRRLNTVPWRAFYWPCRGTDSRPGEATPPAEEQGL